MNKAIAQTLMSPDVAAEPTNEREVADGKLIATLCYVFCPIAIIPLVQRDNGFSLYHAKQALALLVAAIGLSIVLFAVGMLLAMVKLGIVMTILSLAMMAGCIGLIVLGALNAWNGRMLALPVVGGLAQVLLGGVRRK